MPERDLSNAVLALEYLKGFQGALYAWGGQGGRWDCSGVCVETLQATGKLGDGEDLDTRGLARRFPRVEKPEVGVLALYGDGWGEGIEHVMMCMNRHYCWGASGGGGRVDTVAEAERSSAFVKMRPIHYRSDLVGYVDPFLEEG